MRSVFACAGTTVNLCLAGLVAAVRVTSLLSMDMLRNTFVTTVARFTQLHAPASMALKHAQAFRALLVIADENGNHLGVRLFSLLPSCDALMVVGIARKAAQSQGLPKTRRPYCRQRGT